MPERRKIKITLEFEVSPDNIDEEIAAIHAIHYAYELARTMAPVRNCSYHNNGAESFEVFYAKEKGEQKCVTGQQSAQSTTCNRSSRLLSKGESLKQRDL